MCGVVSLCYKDEKTGLGFEASELLKRLEYRGYDSTGASFIGADRNIVLLKKVGAPSVVTKELGMPGRSGQRFIGQVRWATYGAVDERNSQPHEVDCKIHMVGAHNGNISNTDTLHAELEAQGHRLKSENDGEIVVHLVEDGIAANRADPAPVVAAGRRALAAAGLEGAPVPDAVLLMVDAARKAESRADGSYAACVADPEVPGCVAIKSGSSLYAGIGTDSNGPFVVVSSDLTSVLSKTRALIPLAEGEGLWYTHDDYVVFSLGGELRFSKPRPKRSKLDVKETALDPKYSYFMEQEISSTPANVERIRRYYTRDPEADALEAAFEDKRDIAKEAADRVLALSDEESAAKLAAGVDAVFGEAPWRELASRVRERGLRVPLELVSDDKAFLSELEKAAPAHRADLALLDSVLVWRKRRAVLRRLGELREAVRETANSGGRVYLVASGTSFHAALTAAYFFDHLALIPVYPCNPGQFRSMYLGTLSDRDLVVAITQSGETKDLVDILQDAREKAPRVRRASLVNSENSRIPQELSDFYLPILCGPEIAVAATKSFTSQALILWLIASGFRAGEAELREKLARAARLVEDTIAHTLPAVEEAARRLAFEASIHVLGTGLFGLAREGALKVREVVLCHAEGYDAAEFKHGPNTILGKNTVLGLSRAEALLDSYRSALAAAAPAERARLEALPLESLLAEKPEIFEGSVANYPLVFVCPPDERDVRITISQIHTHKIRGADIVLIAEKRADLALAASGRPAGDERYRSFLIETPPTGDRDLFVFSATIVLQWLAFRMSAIKMERLDALRVADHGVHPDVPKNVSKSITVD